MFLILLFKLLTQFPLVSFVSISILSLCSLSQSSLFSLSIVLMTEDFRLSEKMQGFHVENGIDGAILPPIQELLVVIKES